ncbi:MAG: hypothetical protein PHT33_11675 [bacterium]|nr:hypothetical protein [bacterium]
MMALIWKEWREQRVMVAVLLAVLTVFRLVWAVNPQIVGSGIFIVCLSFVLAAVIGVRSFTTEAANGTNGFIFSRAIDVARFFWIKYLSGLLLTAGYARR